MEHDDEVFIEFMEDEAMKEQQNGGLTKAQVNLTFNCINV